MEKLIKEAFIAGYEQGHNDTVESGYGCSPDKADEYYADISNQVQAGVKPKIIAKKTYLITVTEYDNNTVTLSRDNSGVGTFELIGILSVIIDENKKRYITESKSLDQEVGNERNKI